MVYLTDVYANTVGGVADEECDATIPSGFLRWMGYFDDDE